MTVATLRHTRPALTPLPAFTGGASRCPKCLTVAARTEYREGSHDGIRVEWLQRTCVCCGFGWREACQDAPEGLVLRPQG